MFSTALCITAIKWTTHVTFGRPLYRRTYRLSLCCSATLRVTWISICWRYALLLRSNKVNKFEGDQCGGPIVSELDSEARGPGSGRVGFIVSRYAATRHFTCILTIVNPRFTKEYWYKWVWSSFFWKLQVFCKLGVKILSGHLINLIVSLSLNEADVDFESPA